MGEKPRTADKPEFFSRCSSSAEELSIRPRIGLVGVECVAGGSACAASVDQAGQSRRGGALAYAHSMTTSRQLLKEESGQYTPKLVAVFYGQSPPSQRLAEGSRRLTLPRHSLRAAVFDPTLGPRVVHQIPEGSVATALSTFPSRTSTPGVHAREQEPTAAPPVPPATAAAEPAVLRANPVLFDFSSILDFVIPKPELCGHLITKATRTSKILGFPIR